jgi:hypothetical protein
MSLIKHLQTIRDFRTQPDYPLWAVLLLVVMGTMSGCSGYRPLAAFVSSDLAPFSTIQTWQWFEDNFKAILSCDIRLSSDTDE